MFAASRHLTGRHDFSAFMASGSDIKDATRTIKNIDFKKNGNLTSINVTADGFLRHMVRIIVGTLIEVGKSKIEVGMMNEILKSKDYKMCLCTGMLADSKKESRKNKMKNLLVKPLL